MATIAIIDPTFSRAYRLLFSDDPDSAEQMRAMLDDALKQKYGTHKTLSSVIPKLIVDESEAKDNPLEIMEDPESEESNPERMNNSPENELNELNILEEDLSCVICRQMMQSDGNRLVECQECHGLYHQECHQPPVNEAEIPVNDPRLAWYCAACKKKLNKVISTIKSQKPLVPVPTVTPSPTKSSASNAKQPFTSSKTYSSSGSKASSVPKSSIKAGSPSRPSASGSSTSKTSKSSNTKAPIQTISMINADKRLQMMKKKAAAANKNQDKKK